MDDGSNLVTVSCSGHHETLVSGLWKSLVSQRDLDSHLRWSERTVKVHKLVADVFLTPDCVHPATLPKTDKGGGHELDSLLEFLYTGRVTVPSNTLPLLLDVAKELQFKMLVDTIVEMQECVDSDGEVEEAEEPEWVPEPRKKRRRLAVSMRKTRKVGGTPIGSTKKSIASRRSANRKTTSPAPTISEDDITQKEMEPIAVYSNSGGSISSENQEIDQSDLSPTSANKQSKSATKKKSTRGNAQKHPRYTCSKCDFKTYQRNQYDLHLAEHDPSIILFACEKCDKKFVSEVAKDRHLYLNCGGPTKDVQSQNPTASTSATPTNSRKQAIPRKRVPIVNAGQPSVTEPPSPRRPSARRGVHLPLYKCTECDFKSRNSNLYELHRAEHDPSIAIFTCEKCDKKFVSEIARDRHQFSSCLDKDSRHRCQHCDYKTGSLYRFQIHQAKHDPNIEIFRCDYCATKFANQASLSRHKCVLMAGANLYSCSECDYRSAHWMRFRVHQSTHDPSITIYRCSICRRACISEEQLSKHFCRVPSSQEVTLHPCAECKFVAKCASQLKYHVQAMHSIEKAFKCEEPDCNYETGRKSSIKRHVAVTHQGIRKFVCEVCGHRSITQQNLNDHYRIHTGVKPFCCTHCDARFAKSSSLKSHVERHISYERPHVCHICGSAFNQRYTLTSHLRNVHKAETSRANST